MSGDAREAAMHDAARSFTSAAQMVVAGVALSLLPLVPAVRATLRIEPWQMAVGVGGCTFAIVLATIVFRLAGARSRLYRAVDRLETLFIEAGILWLVFASGRADAFFWFLYFAHLAASAGMVSRAREHLAIFGGLPVLLALAFLLVRHDVAGAVICLCGGALGAIVLRMGIDIQRRLDAVVAERERLAAELGALRIRDERERIARDLHDGLAADLAAVAWRAQLVRHELADGATRAELGAIIERASQGIDELRSVVWALRAPARRWSEVTEYLRARCEELCVQRVGFTLRDLGEQEGPGGAEEISGELSMHLMRMIQESVRNAVRHANARSIRVELRRGETIEGVVVDDGVGIDPAALSRATGGLANLRARAKAVGGRVVIEAGPAGSRIAISLPR
jgi:signal transduction histidine kinase